PCPGNVVRPSRQVIEGAECPGLSGYPRRSKAGGGDPCVAQATTPPSDPTTDRKMGGETRRSGHGLLPSAHEDQVGRLQSPGAAHSAEYGTREETQGSPRIYYLPRNGTPTQTTKHRPFC